VNAPGLSVTWPSSRDFSEAIQNPRTAFSNPELRDYQPALDRFGMPLVASGNFAYAFKLRDLTSKKSTGVRCFRGFLPDRDKRYSLIDLHLNAHPTPALSDFDFEPEGISVAGRKYPIVLMEWIEGPNLDSYVEQILGNKAAFQQLADQWLKVIESLKGSQVAHGDLQHGNIIVQNGQCRLIDLDGMYVPGMRGWKSSELGHRHYQHPKRDSRNFGDTLDNFSAIVIYLSLIALAEAPNLWKTYHDENLIFTKDDFTNPSASRLFAEVRKLGQTHIQLCDVIERASRGPAEDTPYLLNLVTRKSKLPSWMMPQTNVQVQARTREVRPDQVIAQPNPSVHSQSISSPQFSQLAFSGVAAPPIPLPNRPRLDWSQVARLAWPRALKIGFGGLFFFWVWVPLLQGIGQGMGLDKDGIFALVFWGYIFICTGIAFSVTVNKLQHPTPAPKFPGYSAPPPISPRRPIFSSLTTTQGLRPTYSGSTQAGGSVVASKIRHIYHRPTCEWVLKMSNRNRVNFSSAQDAIRRGHRPCKVCRP
jgi:hypothetical protein